MWIQSNQLLSELKESHETDIKLLNDSFDNKTKELSLLVKDIKKCTKDKKKLLLEMEIVEKAINKANSNITKAEEKSDAMQDYIDKWSKKMDDNKENAENVMNVWNTIGLRVEKNDQFLNIKFNKISANDPNKWFSVKIKIEDQKISVLETEPKECLDSQPIERQFNERTDDSKLDFRHLIAFIRNQLKKNNSK